MTIERSIHQLLSAVTLPESSGVYPLIVPQDSDYPAVTWQVISDVPSHHLDDKADIRRARVQVDCWSNDHDQASQMADKIAETIETSEAANVGPMTLWAVREIDRRTRGHRPGDASDGLICQVSTDYRITYETAAPIV